MLQKMTKYDIVEKTQLEILDLIVERYRRRTAWHKAEKSLTLQGRAICRRLCDGDKDAANELFDGCAKLKPDEVNAVLSGELSGFDGGLSDIEVSAVEEVHPILVARFGIEICRTRVESELEMMVKKLPICAFIDAPEQSGVSYGSLAAIIGSAGNLYTYVTVQRLWKRMGLAVMPNGRQRPMRDAEQAKLHGYSPSRRSVMWNVGTSILRSQSERVDKTTGVVDEKTGKVDKKTCDVKRQAGPYRELYDERRAYESAKNDAGDYAEQAAKRLSEANFKKTTAAYKAYCEGKLPPLHLHARAQRYVEKRFLTALWVAWRKTMEMPPAPEPVLEDVEAESDLEVA